MSRERLRKRHNHQTELLQPKQPESATNGFSEQTHETIPTTLQLFYYSTDQVKDMRVAADTVPTLRSQIYLNTISYERYAKEVLAKMERLDEYDQQLSEQGLRFGGGRAGSFAYLKLHDELTAMGVPEAEILHFFKDILAVHVDTLGKFALQRLVRDEGGIIIGVHYVSQSERQKKDQEIFHALREQPAWFKGTIGEWKSFVLNHVNFTQLLGLDMKSRRHKKGVFSEPELEEMLAKMPTGVVHVKGVPEWLNRYTDTPPPREEVIDELRKDDNALEKLFQREVASEREYFFLRDQLVQKSERSIQFVDDRLDAVFPKPLDLGSTLLYLQTIEGFGRYTKGAPSSNYMTWDKIQQGFTPKEEYFEQELRKHASSEFLSTSKDMLALWFEDTLRKSGVITTAQEPLNPQLARNLLSLYDRVRNQEDTQQSDALADFRQTNKKGYNALVYDLKPLLQMVSADELNFLRDITKDMLGFDVEVVLHETAELLSDTLRHSDHTKLPQQTKRVYEEIKKFSSRWFRANWRWAYDVLSKRLTEERVEKPTPKERVIFPEELFPKPKTIERPKEHELSCNGSLAEQEPIQKIVERPEKLNALISDREMTFQFDIDEPQEVPKPRHVFLTHNDLLLSLNDFLSHASVNWSEVTRDYQKWLLRSFYEVEGELFEIHINQLIDKFATRRENIILDPIPDFTIGKNYRFDHGERGTNVYAYEKRKDYQGNMQWRAIREYDRLLIMDDLPIVVESKMVRIGDAFEKIIQPEYVQQTFAPLSEYFGTNAFGYLIITAPSAADNSTIQEHFRERGGFITGIMTPHSQFKRTALDIYTKQRELLAG